MNRGRLVAPLAVVLAVVLSDTSEAQMPHPGEVECLAFSDDGKYLLTVTRAAVRDDESLETQVRVWDVNVGAAVKKSEDFQKQYRKETRHRAFYLTITSCQVEPPILGILDGAKVNFYDWERQRLVGKKILKRPTWARSNARLHRSGAIPGVSAAFLEVGYEAGPKGIHAFAVPSGKPLPEVQRRIESLFEAPIMDGLRTHDANVAFVDNVRGAGMRVAFVGYRGADDRPPVGQPEQARVWDKMKSKIIATVPSDLTGPVALSKDGGLVATVRGDLDVRVFRVASGRDYHLEKRELLAKKAEEMGVSVRYGYRKGSIGERYVPEAANLLYTGSGLILYLDGRPASLEQLSAEIDAEQDEIMKNYTAFFGVENRSTQDVIIDLLIEVPISISDWETVASFWQIDSDYFEFDPMYLGRSFSVDYRGNVEVGEKRLVETKESRLLLRRQFGVRAGDTVKDRIALGKREPADLSISIVDILPVEPGWLADLERILAARVESWESATAIRDRARDFLGDRRALGYRRSLNAKLLEVEELIAVHEQEQWRHRLSISLEIPDNYDPDFFNDVKVWITSAASSALRVQLRGPDGKSFAVLVPAKGAQSHVVQIQRMPREELLFEVIEATAQEP